MTNQMSNYDLLCFKMKKHRFKGTFIFESYRGITKANFGLFKIEARGGRFYLISCKKEPSVEMELKTNKDWITVKKFINFYYTNLVGQRND